MSKYRLLNWFAGSMALLATHTSSTDALIVSSVKSLGMAGTVVSHPIDAFAAVYNPAGLTAIPDRFDVGLFWVQTYQRSRIRDLPTYPPIIVEQLGGLQPSDLNTSYDAAKTPNHYGGEFAIKKGWCSNFCNRRVEFAAGFNVHSVDATKTTYGRPVPFQGTTKLGAEHLLETASLVFAAKICDMHSFGVTADYNIQRFKFNGFENLDNPFISKYPGHVTNRGYNYSQGWGTSLGYLFEYRCFKFGASWFPKVSMKKVDKYEGFIPDKGNVDMPQRFAVGASYRFCSSLTLAFDVEHIWWKNSPYTGNPLIQPIPPGADPTDYQYGGVNGPGLGFRNQTFYRVGAEYDFNPCYTFRVGYLHHKTATRNNQTLGNMHVCYAYQDLLTFGATWKYNECQEFSIMVLNGFTHKIKGKDSIPATVPKVINGHLVHIPINEVVGPHGFTGERAGGEVDLKQRLLGLGIAYGYYF